MCPSVCMTPFIKPVLEKQIVCDHSWCFCTVWRVLMRLSGSLSNGGVWSLQSLLEFCFTLLETISIELIATVRHAVEKLRNNTD